MMAMLSMMMMMMMIMSMLMLMMLMVMVMVMIMMLMMMMMVMLMMMLMMMTTTMMMMADGMRRSTGGGLEEHWRRTSFLGPKSKRRHDFDNFWGPRCASTFMLMRVLARKSYLKA